MRSAGATVPRTGPLERNPWGAASTTGPDDTCQRAVMENRQPDWCSLPPYRPPTTSITEYLHRVSPAANPRFWLSTHPFLFPPIVVMSIYVASSFHPKVLQLLPHSTNLGRDPKLYILCNTCWALTKPYEHSIYIISVYSPYSKAATSTATLPMPIRMRSALHAGSKDRMFCGQPMSVFLDPQFFLLKCLRQQDSSIRH